MDTERYKIELKKEAKQSPLTTKVTQKVCLTYQRGVSNVFVIRRQASGQRYISKYSWALRESGLFNLIEELIKKK